MAAPTPDKVVSVPGGMSINTIPTNPDELLSTVDEIKASLLPTIPDLKSIYVLTNTDWNSTSEQFFKVVEYDNTTFIKTGREWTVKVVVT